MYRQTDKKVRHMDEQVDRKMEKQIKRQKDRSSGIQTNIETERWGNE